MTINDRITDSVKRQMELSGLLNEKLGVVDCWHRPIKSYNNPNKDFELYRCLNEKCKYTDHQARINGMFLKELTNPNLFQRSAFLDVWDAVKDREGFKEKFYHIPSIDGDYRYGDLGIDYKHIASPHFQYEVLKWLLEQDSEMGRLEKAMKEVGL